MQDKSGEVTRPIATFSIATSERWKGNDGKQMEKTEWINIVAFGRLAEICGEYLHKGKQIYIQGKIQTRSWEKDGQKHYKTEVIAREMKMLGKRDDDARDETPAPGNDSALDDGDYSDKEILF